MLVEPARREYRTWAVDSRRWNQFRPRDDDIVIATYPKCGTTWMQRIVSLLVFQTTKPMPITDISPWLDQRFAMPVERVIARIEIQDHRRFVKTHLPFDGLPIYDEVKYVHVARDGRDAAISFHNHTVGFTSAAVGRLSKAGLDDEQIARPYPAILEDPAAFFNRWITRGVIAGHDDGSPNLSYFRFERTWWEARERSNVLLVHYNDLKADLDGEMRRVAGFLEIDVTPDLWPDLVGAAGFAAMQRDGDILVAGLAPLFREGSRTFLHKGTNGRWRGIAHDHDIALYEEKARTMLSSPCAAWLAHGRRGGDPRSM
jgi:aryl sulfotransferase